MRFTLVPALLAATLFTAAHAQSTYEIKQTWLLGGKGGWDYIVPDPANHRLFIARESHVMVVDENTGKQIADITDIHGAHGTAIAAEFNHGFATSSEDKSVVMFDATTYKFLKRIPAADDADAILFDKPSGRVFSLNGDAANATVIDARTGDAIQNIPLGGKPEYGVSAGDGKAYVNIQDKGEIVEIDTKALKISKRWSTAPCTQPTSLSIDTEHHRLFSGCRSGVVAVSDYDAGKIVATAPIGKGVDGGSFDPASHNAFTSNGEGTLTVIHQDDADHYHVVQTLTTFVGSRNMALDPITHKIFIVSAKFGPVPPGGRRGPVLPDSFSVSLIAPK